jgi:hypothetical protein
MTRGVRLVTEWLCCNFAPPVALHGLPAPRRELPRARALQANEINDRAPNRQ